MWASVMSTKTSSTGSTSNSLEDPEKTPPREEFEEDIARTPPPCEKPNSNPVTTPTKILEVKSQIALVEISEGVVEADFVETQEIPDISFGGDEIKEIEGSKDTSDNSREKQSASATLRDCGDHENELEGKALEASKMVEEDDKDLMPKLQKDEGPMLLIDEDDDMPPAEDDETDCEIDDKEETTNQCEVEAIETAEDGEDDDLQITGEQEACSLVITHVKEVEEVSKVAAVDIVTDNDRVEIVTDNDRADIVTDNDLDPTALKVNVGVGNISDNGEGDDAMVNAESDDVPPEASEVEVWNYNLIDLSWKETVFNI